MNARARANPLIAVTASCPTCKPMGIVLAADLHSSHLWRGKVATGARGCCNHELADKVLKAVAAKQHDKEFGAVHEVNIQALRTVLVIALPQLRVPQHLHHSSCVPTGLNGVLPT